MAKSTFIKLDRNILKWRWYHDANTLRLWIHLLLTANIKDNDFEKVTVHRGELLTSYPSLSASLDMSIKEVRTALGKLKETGEVAVKSTSKYSIITIKNYNDYQDVGSQRAVEGQALGSQRAVEGQALGSQRAVEGQQSKNVKNIKNIKNEREGELLTLGRFNNVFLTQDEINQLVQDYPDEYNAKIERLSRYLANSGKRYNNHFSTLLDWLEKDAKPKTKQPAYESSSIDYSKLRGIVIPEV